MRQTLEGGGHALGAEEQAVKGPPVAGGVGAKLPEQAVPRAPGERRFEALGGEAVQEGGAGRGVSRPPPDVPDDGLRHGERAAADGVADLFWRREGSGVCGQDPDLPLAGEQPADPLQGEPGIAQDEAGRAPGEEVRVGELGRDVAEVKQVQPGNEDGAQRSVRWPGRPVEFVRARIQQGEGHAGFRLRRTAGGPALASRSTIAPPPHWLSRRQRLPGARTAQIWAVGVWREGSPPLQYGRMGRSFPLPGATEK